MEARTDAPSLETSRGMPWAPLHSVFSGRIKIFVIVMTVTSSLFSPFTNFVYLPALNTLARDLAVSTADINFSVTTYQVYDFSFAPEQYCFKALTLFPFILCLL